MDLRDSSPSSTPNRDGNAGDDDGVLSVTSALAKDAALYFQSRKFADCVDVLNQLNSKKENDPKVLHNIAIAEFFRDGCSDPKKLLEVLNNVKKRSEELALRASGEQVESGSNIGNNITSGSKGCGTTTSLPASNCASIIYTDEFDTSVASLNIAVIWFHLHEYSKALSVLEHVYQNIEPIDETTALHICLLLLDVLLACRDVSKSADVLNYLEKAFGVGNVSQGENGNTAPQQSWNVVGKSSSDPNSSLISDVSCSDLAASVNASESPLSRTLSEDPLDEMFSTLDIGGQNLARHTGLTSANDLPRITVDRSISGVDLKLKLQLYKVRLLLLTRNVKLAKREVKHAMNIARGRDSSMALFLKAQLERENQMIKQALLANLAYVELELENPLKALSAAQALLELPDCSRIYVFLGHVYVAEALCLLNKPKEAAEHLSIYLSGESNIKLPFGLEDCEQWRVKKHFDCEEANVGAAAAKNSSPEGLEDFMFLKPEEARGTLYANLAAVSAIQGDLERAHHFVTQALSLVPNSSEATMTAIYVDLILGKSQEAVSKLKHCSHVRFLPSNQQFNKSS
ncbi:hypothetical protein GOBAR_DD14255 [Gossypium barbadense]|nr:hypothetical protein GOBAR_DD14255 [Gossypium barbadense]